MIRATGLHKRFGTKVAVDDVTFEAPDGCITGLLGPNGAGKTTTLRMLSSLVVPDRGHAEIDGLSVHADRAKVLARLGTLPDARGLYPRLSARENVRYFGELHDLAGDALDAEIDRLFDLLDMRELADRRVHGFSQGERVKVAIARALVHRPSNVMLDEPTNGLDVMSTRAMRTVIRTLRDDGRCVVFSSHVMQEVAALCDTIVVVARGRVVASGTPDELRAQTGKPDLEDAFVAAIGSDEGLTSA
jgi:sodium transport system ATP-binding protein